MNPDYRYRPELSRDIIERLLKLTNEIGLSPNKTVNIFVKIGLEVIERSTKKITIDVKNKLEKILIEFENERQKDKTN